jgi:hypothetical protein
VGLVVALIKVEEGEGPPPHPPPLNGENSEISVPDFEKFDKKIQLVLIVTGKLN